MHKFTAENDSQAGIIVTSAVTMHTTPRLARAPRIRPHGNARYCNTTIITASTLHDMILSQGVKYSTDASSSINTGVAH